jgi:hypothetical protein
MNGRASRRPRTRTSGVRNTWCDSSGGRSGLITLADALDRLEKTNFRTRGACKEILKPHPDQWWMPVLTQLWEAGRLKWSAEAVALRPEFEPLFTADERARRQGGA